AHSDGRLPHPENSSGSKLAPTGWFEPNCRLSIGPHSPLSSGLVRTQSGVLLKFESSQLLDTHGLLMPPKPEHSPPPNGIRSAGLELYARLLTLAPSRYFPKLTLIAVLPLPKRS